MTEGRSAVSVRHVIEHRMPILTGKKIKIAGALPTTLRVRGALLKGSPKQDLQRPGIAPGKPVKVAERPQAVQVKVIPTPGMKRRPPAKPRKEAMEPTATKPLKIIRRRREEAPKVFETAPMPVPEAMLAGIKAPEEDSTDNGD